MPPKGVSGNPNGRPKGTTGTKKVCLRKLSSLNYAAEQKKKLAGNRDEVKAAIVEALRNHNGYIDDACYQVGISQATYHEWVKEDSEFKERCEHASVAWLKKSEQRMIQLGQVDKDGFLSYKATSFILEKKGRRIGYEKDSAATQNTTIEIKMSEADTLALKALGKQLNEET